MRIKLLKFTCILLFLSSCIVQSPKYTTIEQVMILYPGMNKAMIEDLLGVEPYDLKATNDSVDVFVYIYRTTDRRTFPFNTKPSNGKESTGKYVQLFITYSKAGKMISMESCSLCPDNLVKTSRIDFDKVLVFVTVTLPVLLVFFGLQNP